MNEQTHTSNGIEIAAEAREWQDGYGNRDNNEVHPHAGIVRDEQVSRVLSIIEECYDPTEAERPDQMPGQAKDLELVQQLRRMEGTETFRQAMDEGDLDALTHFTGNTSKRADVSGLKAIGKIDDLITSPAPVIVILGEMGTGKTDFAGLLGQRWADHQQEDHLVGTNIQSLEEKTRWVDDDGEVQDGWIPDYGTLLEWVQQDGNPLEHHQRPKLFIGDEFSSAASGRGKQGYETAQKMAPLVYKIRKYGGALIYIAHGPKSIHPLLWRVGTIVKKTSQKRAIVADRIESNQVADIQFELAGIPPTDWRCDTSEASPWAWDDHEQEKQNELDAEAAARQMAIWTVIRCKETGMANREVAQYVPYSCEWVGSRWREYRDDDAHRETLATIEGEIA
jgi:hypothetical protein